MKKRILISATAVVILFTTVSFKSDFFEIAKQIEIFTTLFKELNMNYVDEVNPGQLMDSAIEGMLADLDPYTKYWTEQEVEDARISNSGEYTGIGASVLTRNKTITILEAYKDYPADKAGLQAGDELVKIGDINIADFEEDAGDLLQGAPGTSIPITYKRQGKLQTTSLKREEIDIKAVPFYTLIDGSIGYVVLSKFNKKASSETKAAVEDLKAQGATSIILDLRGNPGGLLTEAINVSNLFLPKGKLITNTKSVIEKYNQEYYTRNEPFDTEIPVAVLINGRSASASEIVSGSLQDYDRAVIIGARSFGKGLVQRPKELTYGTQLKITISRYYTPSGRCIQALDYWNRDEQGNAVRTNAADYNEFETSTGRKVYDGGGILPDIQVESAEMSAITEALLRDQAIFDFATDYFYKHDYESLDNFKFTNADYTDFKKFLDAQGFEYQTQTEKELEEVFLDASKDNLQDAISSDYASLMRTIDNAKEAQLNTREREISKLIIDELIKRYFYREGLYEYQITHNEELEEAKKILKDAPKYRKILNR
ncbi:MULTISPECIES: S41 family peptidase [Leeuwenhoekiella]|jgi:carboxyl-terminal processing protease|uniref:S41 family peptidase n=1 Tax=Leeuwenhoekiella TaxID=283735 RepID=UPI000C478F01|nr:MULTISPECIES: S41 family peptidase [Leeuwenhoekiella]MAO45292.1 peptidase S41 [Leeuwenhoekiella sp.]HCW65457.1 peptidase S41 [Leeuwenhoekiella sp.]|tara:strand:+ start:942 stop:2567 length:1626 start_codon:yes stop_codon:yes gene_type:complete